MRLTDSTQVDCGLIVDLVVQLPPGMRPASAAFAITRDERPLDASGSATFSTGRE